ncbi:MAG: hypothetical protein ACKVUS_06135 [Saprospiraceae bacterium]
MTNNATTSGYLGSISEANKKHFPQAVQEAFEFVQANPDAEFFASKNHAAQWQFDTNSARQTLQKLDSISSLKDALAAVLANLPGDRSDEYVRALVQWFIAEFETSFVGAKAFAG